MAAEIVNLRRARKASARAEKARQAEGNRIAHGRSGAEKRLTRALNDLEERRHRAGRRRNDEPGSGGE